MYGGVPSGCRSSMTTPVRRCSPASTPSRIRRSPTRAFIPLTLRRSRPVSMDNAAQRRRVKCPALNMTAIRHHELREQPLGGSHGRRAFVCSSATPASKLPRLGIAAAALLPAPAPTTTPVPAHANATDIGRMAYQARLPMPPGRRVRCQPTNHGSAGLPGQAGAPERPGHSGGLSGDRPRSRHVRPLILARYGHDAAD